MRKVKLQMQVSVDGFVAGPKGEMDWMMWNWSKDLMDYVAGITEPVDTILLGRVLAEGFIPTWSERIKDPQTADVFSHKMVDTSKVVFSRTLEFASWENTRLAKDLAEEVTQLKDQPGGDIIVYGGINFVANLIQLQLIDEYHLFINPVAIGGGMPIFNHLDQKLKLRLIKTTPSDCGIVVLCYIPEEK